MKITINRLIHDELHNGRTIFLPGIGVLYLNSFDLTFHNNEMPHEAVSILELIQQAFNVDEDTSYSRYEFWRRAITIIENGYEIVKIDDVAVIVIDEYDNYNFKASPRLVIT